MTPGTSKEPTSSISSGLKLGLLCISAFISSADKLSARFDESNVTVINSSYTAIPTEILDGDYPKAGAALFDLGLSSIQLDTPERGFSHRTSGPLDMRFNQLEGDPASVVLLLAVRSSGSPGRP